MGEADRIRPSAVAKMTSLSVRKVQELSAAGKIPGAAKLGGVWTYDPADIRKWIKQAERAAQWPEPSAPAISTNAVKLGGDAAKLPDENIEARYAQLIGVKPRVGSKRGGSSSNARR